jgi:hypothetical protein
MWVVTGKVKSCRIEHDIPDHIATYVATNVAATAIEVWTDNCSGQIYVGKAIFYMPRQHKATIGRTSRKNSEIIKIQFLFHTIMLNIYVLILTKFIL